MRALRLMAVLVLLLAVGGCAGQETIMPDVVAKQLDVAKSDIARAGFEGEVEVLGGGLFGILDESNWQVCEQFPAARQVLKDAPRLTVDRSCGEHSGSGRMPTENPTPTESPKPTVSPSTTTVASTTAPTVSPSQHPRTQEPVPDMPAGLDITVDELLDKLNSSGMGGVKAGDSFNVTGELASSESWGTGVTGEYTVYLEAKGGTSDLMVWVSQADARNWRNGTKVEMVLDVVKATINGETSDGWLRARWVKTLA